jgi:two-component system CheB/CheR fusion protein
MARPREDRVAIAQNCSCVVAMKMRASLTSGKALKLKVLASDIEADAVAQAREGLYPASIKAEVSPDRLARFFIKEDRCMVAL